MVAGNPRRSLCGAQALSDLIPRLAITPGEPAGIGPDILLAALQAPRPAQWLAVADPQLLRERAALLGLPLKLTEFDPAQPARAQGPGELCVSPVPLAVPAEPGRLNPANAPYVLACLDRAVDLCQTGQCQALVTGPVQKSVINDAGIAFTGHTEYLAHKAGCQVVMMLATEGLRVALATTHVPLSAVPGAISRASLTRVIEILLQDLRRQFGIARPRLLVCGLNPHAGEGGHLGREEIEVIEPVLEALRGPHCELIGPLPADTLFQPKYLQGADAVLAMYHDQGLPVLKYRGFGAAVNITLGLPYIRTSVDHGTALDLAATGRADTGSLQTAIQYATGMINARLSANNGTET